MPKKYSEQFKMQVAYDYFVDRCPVNALCDKYKLTVHTVRYLASRQMYWSRCSILNRITRLTSQRFG